MRSSIKFAVVYINRSTPSLLKCWLPALTSALKAKTWKTCLSPHPSNTQSWAPPKSDPTKPLPRSRNRSHSSNCALKYTKKDRNWKNNPATSVLSNNPKAGRNTSLISLQKPTPPIPADSKNSLRIKSNRQNPRSWFNRRDWAWCRRLTESSNRRWETNSNLSTKVIENNYLLLKR